MLGLVVGQAMLGFSAGDLPAPGALHGVNALLLFPTALFAGRRARAQSPASADAEPSRPTATV